jgi:alginate O-acetyltransferase complex protein AlgI
MLFHSHYFIFVFLPLVVISTFILGKSGHKRLAMGFLILVSSLFYSMGSGSSLLLLAGSLAVNYALGKEIYRTKSFATLWFGVILNIVVLGYFKYQSFFENISVEMADLGSVSSSLIFPLAISFFTFQQISFLVDIHRDRAHANDFLSYCLFVTFFPQLIAGPIVRYQQFTSQITKEFLSKFDNTDLAIGITIFSLGLFKKTVLADGIAPYSNEVFNSVAAGGSVAFFQAWGGSLAYTFQIYFDFSAYSDMAVGLGRVFGIKIPVNFYSPYKAKNIIDFWRRWHITLSSFLRDYIYIPLGGNRAGHIKQYRNIMCAMVLAGVWHGSHWTYVAWGGLHGVYLVINHLWQTVAISKNKAMDSQGKWGVFLARSITFIAVVIAWVLFRAENMPAAGEIYKGMMGLNGVSIPLPLANLLGSLKDQLQSWGVIFPLDGNRYLVRTYMWVIISMITVWLSPNIYQFMQNLDPTFNQPFKSIMGAPSKKDGPTNNILNWSPSKFWAVSVSLILVVAIMAITSLEEFIYFKF